MAYRRIADPRLSDGGLHEMDVQLTRGRLFLSAGFLTVVSLPVAAAELLRRQVIEDLHVSTCDSTVPLGHATARDRDDPLGIDPIAILEPSKKRDPVQNLETHLRKPRAHDDRPTSASDVRDLTFQEPLRLGSRRLLAQSTHTPRQPNSATRRRRSPTPCLPRQVANRAEGIATRVGHFLAAAMRRSASSQSSGESIVIDSSAGTTSGRHVRP